MGPFSKASSLKMFLLLVTNYFTKWVEAIALVNITDSNVKAFLWENIVSCFGIAKVLVSDNGTQFKSMKILEFCRKFKSKWAITPPRWKRF